MSDSRNVKHRRNYKKYVNKPKLLCLDVNLKGFLCSCNNREKECVRESYNLLNKYTDILYPNVEEKKEEDTSQDISDDLANEVNNLKEKKEHKFQVLESGAKNVLFIRTTLDNPVELAYKIVVDINETKCNQTRFLIRLVPIEVTCKANLKDLEKAFQPLVDKYFMNEAITFSIAYNHRNDNGLTREEVIKKMGEMISDTKIDHKVNLKEAEVSVIVEVIRKFVFIGVVPDYIKYKKYNLIVAPEQQVDDDAE